MRTCLAPNLRTVEMGLKEMRAPTTRDRGVSPAHLGRSSCPSSYVATSDDAAIRTVNDRFVLGLLASAQKARDSFWVGAHSAIEAREEKLNQWFRERGEIWELIRTTEFRVQTGIVKYRTEQIATSFSYLMLANSFQTRGRVRFCLRQ